MLKKQVIKVAIATAILLTGCQLLLAPTYSVQRVSDGDTLTVTDSSDNRITVRFACVDAPEVPHSNAQRQSRKAVDKSQFKWGIQAQQRLQQLITEGGDLVQLTVTDTDRYGRSISEVHLLNGTLVQEVLAREGLALVYRPFLKNCPNADIVEQAEAEAKAAQRGVWGDAKFLPPWEYRRLQRQP